MASLTRQQITSRARALLIEELGALGPLDPWQFDQMLSMVTDDICRGTDCYFLPVTANIVSGQSLYCAPQLYRITGATVKDSGGNIKNLVDQTNRGMDRRYASTWRANPATGTPYNYVTEGENRISLYPVPDYNYTAGLYFEGFGTPGESVWPNQTDSCPLPDRAGQAVVYALAAAYAETNDNVSARKLAAFTARAARQRGKLERETATLTDAMRHADTTSYFNSWAMGSL